jgi:hypothetical protein
VAFLVGALLAVAIGLMATTVGLDRDRAFYPTIMRDGGGLPGVAAEEVSRCE